MTATPYVIIDAPSPLGLWQSGVERLPEALKACNLIGRLPARQGARLTPPEYSRDRDPGTGFLNGPSMLLIHRNSLRPWAPNGTRDQPRSFLAETARYSSARRSG
jgi:hypothetical protein